MLLAWHAWSDDESNEDVEQRLQSTERAPKRRRGRPTGSAGSAALRAASTPGNSVTL